MAKSRSKPSKASAANAAESAPQTDSELVKETCRRIRVARSYWDAHNNRACRHERDRALELYNQLTKAQKQQIPEVLKVWLRYRSEKYFGKHRTPPQKSRSRPSSPATPPAENSGPRLSWDDLR